MSKGKGADARDTNQDEASLPGNAETEGGKEELRRSRAWIPCSFLVLAIFSSVGVAIGWHFRIRNFEVRGGPTTNFQGRIIQLAADLVSVDPIAGNLVLDWSIYDDPSCQPSQVEIANNSFDNQTHAACQNSVNIFFDHNLLSQGSGSGPTDDNVPTTPVFVYNATSYTFDFYGNVAAWRTTIALLDSTNNSVIPVRSLQAYPFDRYTVEVFIFAQDAVTNQTLGTQLAYTTGISPGFSVTAVGTRQDPAKLSIDYYLKISRGTLVKAYAVIIVGSIWVITLIFMQSTVTIVIFGYPQQVEVLVVPVATLFAFTGLRGTMPGAPAGFGAIVDYVGLLPCLALMAMCAAANVGVMVYSNEPTVHRPKSIASYIRGKIYYLFRMDDPKAPKDPETGHTS